MPERVKIHVVPAGKWKGHDAGEQEYGEAELAAIVERANGVVAANGNPIQIDYEHASLDPPASGAPAAGWMYSFTLENDGVYAEVEWTERAAEMIKAGEYKYISPVICTGLKDPVTGEPVPIELFNAALTNQPFLHDAIQQVVANAAGARGGEWFTNTKQIVIPNIQGGKMPDLQKTVEDVIAALPGAKTAEDVIGFLKKASEMLQLMPGAPEGGVMPSPDQMGEMETEMKQMQNSHKLIADIAAEMKVAAEQIIPTIKAMSIKADSGTDAAKELAALKARLAVYDVDKMIADNANRIPPAQVESVRAFANRHGVEAAREMIAQLPELPPDPTKKLAQEPTVDSERIAMARKMGIDPKVIQNSLKKEA